MTFIVRPYEVVSPKQIDVTTATVDNVTIEVGALAAIHGKITRKGQPVKDGILLWAEHPEACAREFRRQLSRRGPEAR